MLALSRNAAHAEPFGDLAFYCSTGKARGLFSGVESEGSNTGSGGNWQVREEQELYVPDLLADDAYELDPDVYAAADEHARHLRKAERLVDEALNLTGVLKAALRDCPESSVTRAGTVLTIIDQRLSKAHRAIDKHGRRHANLFLAYFELSRKGDRCE